MSLVPCESHWQQSNQTPAITHKSSTGGFRSAACALHAHSRVWQGSQSLIGDLLMTFNTSPESAILDSPQSGVNLIQEVTLRVQDFQIGVNRVGRNVC